MRTVQLNGMKGADQILYGEAPYGWRLNPARSGLVKDTDEQRILSVVRHMYLQERLPMRAIVARLEKMNVRNRRGRTFGLSGVWEMIHKRKDAPPEATTKAKASKAKKRP